MTTRYREDRELVRRLLSGDEDAFAELFRDAYPRLYRFCLERLDGDHHAAEEVVQVALTKALKKLGDFRGDSSLVTWLGGFCLFGIKDHYRRLARRPPPVSLTGSAPDLRAVVETLASGETPADDLERVELARSVRRALDRLPRHYARVLTLKYFDGHSVKEIAARLDAGAKAIESLLTRARGAFRDAFLAPRRATGGPVELHRRTPP